MMILFKPLTYNEIALYLMKTNRTLRFLSFIKLYSIAHVYLMFIAKRCHKRYAKNIIKDLGKMNEDFVHNLMKNHTNEINNQLVGKMRTENKYYCDNCGNIDYLCTLSHDEIHKPHCQHCHSTEKLYKKDN